MQLLFAAERMRTALKLIETNDAQKRFRLYLIPFESMDPHSGALCLVFALEH